MRGQIDSSTRVDRWRVATRKIEKCVNTKTPTIDFRRLFTACEWSFSLLERLSDNTPDDDSGGFPELFAFGEDLVLGGVLSDQREFLSILQC